MFLGRKLRRWRVWLVVTVGTLPLMQLQACTPSQQQFWQSVQGAAESMITGLMSAAWAALQNRRSSDSRVGDITAWATQHLTAWWS